jgi:hypothetical protein
VKHFSFLLGKETVENITMQIEVNKMRVEFFAVLVSVWYQHKTLIRFDECYDITRGHGNYVGT